ncbi:DnaD domain protein [Eubacteriales bacterium KG127]
MKYIIEPANDFFLQDTKIENLFVNEYMTTAPGDYVKVYLFGAMCSQHGMEMETKVLASTLGIKEDKIMQAWEYWERIGLIKRIYIGKDGELDFSVQFLKLKNHFYSIGLDKVEDGNENPETEAEVNIFGNEKIKALIQRLESITGSEMSTYGLESIIYLIAERKASLEIIEYAAEYSKERDKANMRYIVKVIENWLKDGINDKESAIRHLQSRDEQYFIYKEIIKNLYGINRPASKAEKDMMNRWLYEERYSLERILEACERTTGSREPNFNYVNKILENMKQDENHTEKRLNRETFVTEQGLERYLNWLREQAQIDAKERAIKLYRDYPEIKETEKKLQEAFRNRIIKGHRGGAALREEYDKLIDELKAKKETLLKEAGYDEDYLEPKYRCEICGDTCSTEEGVCICKPLRMEEARDWLKESR